MNKKEYFKCYSHKLRRFIQAHGIYPVSTGINAKTDKVYYLFKVTDDLSRILTNWSKSKETEKRA